MAIVYFIIFVIGIIFGSFYNVVGLRSLKGESLSYPPSHCVKCGYNLKAKDLIPIFSWLSLGGKCRSCKVPISPIYPIGEFFTGITFTILFYKYGSSQEFLIHAVFMSFMIMATVSDLEAMLVPNRFVIVGSIVIIALQAFFASKTGDFSNVFNNVIAGLIMATSLFLLMYVTSYKIEDPEELQEVIQEIEEENKERVAKGKKIIEYDVTKLRGYKMGGADAKIYLLIGSTIGLIKSVESLILASLSAAIIMGAIQIKERNITRKTAIPFFPFITIGVLLTYFINVYEILMKLY